MPLRVVPPRVGKSPNYTIRGTHLGVRVNRSAKTSDGRKAEKVRAKIRDEIERGAFSRPGEPTFAGAALKYIKAGGERRYLDPILAHFGGTLLKAVDQQATDDAAIAIYPIANAATRNRQVYTPISAVLKHAGITARVARPAGWRGSKRVDWLWPEQALPLLETAEAMNAEFGILMTVILYTGLRLNEALALEIDRMRLADGFVYVPDTKNDDPRSVYLPPFAVAALTRHPRGLDRPGERVFKFHKSGRLYELLDKAAMRAGVTIPDGVAFHILRHTWATWMRRYGGLDTAGLVGTGAWRDRTSASRYEHVVVSEEARKADLLPTTLQRTSGVKSVEIGKIAKSSRKIR